MPVHEPPTHAWFTQVSAGPQDPPSHVDSADTPASSATQVVPPLRQSPVQPPSMHVAFMHDTGVPHMPLEHVCCSTPEHSVALPEQVPTH